MKKERILKTIVVLLIGVVLFTMSSNVFAADSNSKVDFWEDTTNQLNTTPSESPTSQPTTTDDNNSLDLSNSLNTNGNTNGNTNNNYNTNLPKAGAPENTMLVVGITILAISAIYAYKKINQYKNI